MHNGGYSLLLYIPKVGYSLLLYVPRVDIPHRC